MGKAHIKENAIGIDKVVNKIQQVLIAQLPWLEHSFGVSERRVRQQANGSSLSRYIYPSIYVGSAGYGGVMDGEYMSMEPDDRVGNMCYFEVDDPESIDARLGEWRNPALVPVSIIFWFDMRTIFGDGKRNVEDVVWQIKRALNDAYEATGAITIAQVYRQKENVYRGYTLDEVQTQFMMQPYCALRVSGTLYADVECDIDIPGPNPEDDATITPGDVLEGEIGYNNGERVVGIIPRVTYEPVTPTAAGLTLQTARRYAENDIVILGDIDLQPENVRKGVDIFGVVGTLDPVTARLQSKIVTIVENSVINVEPDAGYDGLTNVGIEVDVPHPEPVLQSKHVDIVENGDYNIEPDSGYEGLTDASVSVMIPPPVMQTKEVEFNANGSYNVMPDADYDGLGSVDIEVAIPFQEKTVEITANGDTEVVADAEYGALSKVNIHTAIPAPRYQAKGITLTENRALIVTPDIGYDALSQVDIVVDVPPVPPELQSKAVTITENGTTEVTYDAQYDGLERVEITVDVTPPPLKLDVASTNLRLGYSQFTQIPDNLDFANVQSAERMFSNAPNLQTVDLVMPNCTSLNFAFIDCNKIQNMSLDLGDMTVSVNTAFTRCSSMTDFYIKAGRMVSFWTTFHNCSALQNLTIDSIIDSGGVDFSYSPLLTVDSLVSILTALSDRSGISSLSIALGATNIAKLSEEQKQIATGKNWILT